MKSNLTLLLLAFFLASSLAADCSSPQKCDCASDWDCASIANVSDPGVAAASDFLAKSSQVTGTAFVGKFNYVMTYSATTWSLGDNDGTVVYVITAEGNYVDCEWIRYSGVVYQVGSALSVKSATIFDQRSDCLVMRK
eukprot:TRINITY_DN7969_c0_g1_i2.p1 TRINITY_DN7969_c0_g1~~TRINITY_DN7969_c0_g1_i2.p1  ORF type:complete len:153 (+),score=29.10 TRINITY_DN7969_c0_g1_i2:46-459(+)